MTMYGNNEKDYMYDAIEEFLETHELYELMQMITDYLERQRW